MNAHFATADLIDLAPDTPSCQLPLQHFGRRLRFCGRVRTAAARATVRWWAI